MQFLEIRHIILSKNCLYLINYYFIVHWFLVQPETDATHILKNVKTMLS